MTGVNERVPEMDKTTLLQLLEDRDIQEALCALVLKHLPSQVRYQGRVTTSE